jgi:hypothetical protein
MIRKARNQRRITSKQNEDMQLAFKVQTLTVDLNSGMANVVAIDQTTQPFKVVNVQFPHAEGQDKNQILAAAKVILQQAINEL